MGCYFLSSARPVAITNSCKVVGFDIFSNELTDNRGESGIDMYKNIIIKTEKGNVYYENFYYPAGFGCRNKWIRSDLKEAEIYYNKTLEKIYIKSNGSFYVIADSDSVTGDDVVNCNESDFYISYGNVNGYEIFSATQIYKDFNNKIDLGETLYSLSPPSITYDIYSKKYVVVTKDSDSLYIKETLDFKTYNTLYTSLLKNVTYCNVANFFTIHRTTKERN